jgi:mannose-6-phosphate isomerase-like protein (cupin superfamily)
VSFSPEKSWIHTVDRAAARATFATLGAGHAPVAAENPPHPLMHRTKTIDYAIVLSGEIYMVLDDSEVFLQAGDTIIQRGTNHAWSNRSEEPCVIAFVLIDGEFDRDRPRQP